MTNEVEDPRLVKLGRALMLARVRAGVSKETVASALRSSVTQVDALESGQLDVEIAGLLRVADALGVSLFPLILRAEADVS